MKLVIDRDRRHRGKRGAMTLHITTAQDEDVERVAKRQKTPEISWAEARRRAWAWIRAMSGIPAWPVPKPEDNPRVKRERAPRKRLKPDKRLRSNPWWKITLEAKKRRSLPPVPAGALTPGPDGTLIVTEKEEEK
jgi:hypothetical protein